MASKEAKYVKTTLTKGEKVLEIFQEHWILRIEYWIYYVGAPFAVFLAWMISAIAEIPIESLGGQILWGFSLAIGAMAIYQHVAFYSREIVLTNKRFIFKRGIIARSTEEQLLTKTDTVEMDQGIIARMFNYGRIKLTTTGGASVSASTLVDPIKVKMTIEEAL